MQDVKLSKNSIYSSNSSFKASLKSGSFNFHLLSVVAIKTELVKITNAAYFFVQAGKVEFSLLGNKVISCTGMFGVLEKGNILKVHKGSRVIIILVKNLKPINTIGGPIEKKGRLNYINGCSDTLLISPTKLGEPCLNHLHFPKNIAQSMHYHPSFRFGIVASGTGVSVSEQGEIKLSPGDVFFIPENVNHKFNTTSNFLNVIAFHPDSDWGPTDEVHPMKNRTWFR